MKLHRFYWRYVRRYDGEICQDCGRPVRVVWNAPDALWFLVMGGPGGILDPVCFAKKLLSPEEEKAMSQPHREVSWEVFRRGRTARSWRYWTMGEDRLVRDHRGRDACLAKKLGRTVTAIRMRRSRLKREGGTANQ
jgi:hypothetical protein